ncbi:MAG TPA: hypothetical protein VN726_00260 [Hanamia sp.]|nr:hypothetical protein [Hanamia sp.]
MNINRNNYEEYFLLYADNELSPVERKVVEIFVQENIDLKEEFLMIKMTLNVPDEDIKLSDKSFLQKKVAPFINENNYEEIFVLYHDNELSIEEKTEVDNFTADHTQLKTEFNLIGKTTFVPDLSISFPNKKSLYKKEKSGRVVPIILWRSMAAAIVVGVGLWAGIAYFSTPTEKGSIAGIEKSTKPLITTEPKIVSEDSQSVAVVPKAQPVKTGDAPTLPKAIKEKNNVAKELNPNKNIVAQKTTKGPEVNVVKDEIDLHPEQKNDLVASNIPVRKPSEKIEGTKSLITTNEAIQHIDKYDERIQPQTPVSTASYASDNITNNENYVFYNVKAEDFNKSKVGGFLKKVKRIVERGNPITRLLSGEEKQVASN